MARMNEVGSYKTTITTDAGETHVTYHVTRVVSFNRERIILRSGGWETVTTKARMNQTSNQFGLGYQVYQRNHVWYVDFRGRTWDFTDGMELPRTGELPPETPDDAPHGERPQGRWLGAAVQGAVHVGQRADGHLRGVLGRAGSCGPQQGTLRAEADALQREPHGETERPPAEQQRLLRGRHEVQYRQVNACSCAPLSNS